MFGMNGSPGCGTRLTTVLAVVVAQDQLARLARLALQAQEAVARRVPPVLLVRLAVLERPALLVRLAQRALQVLLARPGQLEQRALLGPLERPEPQDRQALRAQQEVVLPEQQDQLEQPAPLGPQAQALQVLPEVAQQARPDRQVALGQLDQVAQPALISSSLGKLSRQAMPQALRSLQFLAPIQISR
jgi:hypothetical protein